VGLFLPRHLGYVAREGMIPLVEARAGLLRIYKEQQCYRIVVAHFPHQDLESFFKRLATALQQQGINGISDENVIDVMVAETKAVASHSGRASSTMSYHDRTFATLFHQYLSPLGYQEILGRTGPTGATWRTTGVRHHWSVIDRAWVDRAHAAHLGKRITWGVAARQYQLQAGTQSQHFHYMCSLAFLPGRSKTRPAQKHCAAQKPKDEVLLRQDSFCQQVGLAQIRILQRHKLLPDGYLATWRTHLTMQHTQSNDRPEAEDGQLQPATLRHGAAVEPANPMDGGQDTNGDEGLSDWEDHRNHTRAPTLVVDYPADRVATLQLQLDEETVSRAKQADVHTAISDLTRLAHDLWRATSKARPANSWGPLGTTQTCAWRRRHSFSTV